MQTNEKSQVQNLAGPTPSVLAKAGCVEPQRRRCLPERLGLVCVRRLHPKCFEPLQYQAAAASEGPGLLRLQAPPFGRAHDPS